MAQIVIKAPQMRLIWVCVPMQFLPRRRPGTPPRAEGETKPRPLLAIHSPTQDGRKILPTCAIYCVYYLYSVRSVVQVCIVLQYEGPKVCSPSRFLTKGWVPWFFSLFSFSLIACAIPRLLEYLPRVSRVDTCTVSY